MAIKKVGLCAVLVAGIVASLAGGLAILAYLLEAVVARAGEPDQSLLFWYLPFLLFGLPVLIAGLKLLTWGICRLRKSGQGYPLAGE